MRSPRRLNLISTTIIPLAAAGAALAPSAAFAQDRTPVRVERTAAAPAPASTERPQVAAATAEAVANLRDSIERAPINHRISVGEFVRRSGSEHDLTQALMRAELVGGPRWVDDDTCQVQLEMSGPRVARVLQQIAINRGKDSPASSEELSHLSEDWGRRTFTGLGTSTAFHRVEHMRPAPGSTSAWAGVTDADRQRALAAARADAINHVIDSVRPIVISRDRDGKDITVDDAMTHPEVKAALTNWLENRPVTRVEYRRDLQLELSMAGTPGGCFDVVRRAVTERTDLPIPRDEPGWARVRESFERQMASPIGRATVAAAPPMAMSVSTGSGGTTTATATPLVPAARAWLPATPPEWIDRKLEAEGVAEAGGFKLKAAREAEAIARRRLADSIGDLPLSGGLTIARAAERDPRLKSAISDALDKARPRTDYNHGPGGSVSVLLRLDLHDLWDALRATE